MAYLVEDGTGLAGSNSYNTALEFNTYHTDRQQITTAEFSDALINAHQIRARDYIDKRFGRRFRGYKLKKNQGCEWPRIDAYDNDDYLLNGIPSQLKEAHHEYTLISLRLERNLAPIPGLEFAIIDPETGETTSTVSGRVTAKTEKVGPIEEHTEVSASGQEYSSVSKMSSTVQNIPEYPQADLWIEELLVSGKSKRLVRG